MKLRTFLQLIRVQNLPTAVADTLAGFFIANTGQSFGAEHGRALAVAALASACLYSGGMANNDAQHARKDRMLDKPRPIVRGDVSSSEAHWNSMVLMIAGILAAYSVAGKPGFLIGGIIAVFCLIYNRLARGSVGSDGYIRPSALANASGTVLLAQCRVLNVGLGMAAAIATTNGASADFMEMVAALDIVSWLTLASVFIYFLTVIGVSLLEDYGGGRKTLKVLAWLTAIIVLVAPLVPRCFESEERPWVTLYDFATALSLSMILRLILESRFQAAVTDPKPPVIGQVVRWGIIGEPLFLGAMVAMATGEPLLALAIAALTPACLVLSRFSHST